MCACSNVEVQPGIAAKAVIKDGHVKEVVGSTLGARDARVVAPDAMIDVSAKQDVSAVGVDGKLNSMAHKDAAVEVLKKEVVTTQKKITDGPVESHPTA